MFHLVEDTQGDYVLSQSCENKDYVVFRYVDANFIFQNVVCLWDKII